MARLVAQGFEDVAVTAREVPDIAGAEIIGLRTALRVDHRGAHLAFGDERPFRCGGVPMQFAHHARLHAHRDAGDPFGDRQLRDRRFLAVAAAHHASCGLLQLELEGGELLSGRDGIGNVVLKAGVAAFRTDEVVNENMGLPLCAARNDAGAGLLIPTLKVFACSAANTTARRAKSGARGAAIVRGNWTHVPQRALRRCVRTFIHGAPMVRSRIAESLV